MVLKWYCDHKSWSLVYLIAIGLVFIINTDVWFLIKLLLFFVHVLFVVVFLDSQCLWRCRPFPIFRGLVWHTPIGALVLACTQFRVQNESAYGSVPDPFPSPLKMGKGRQRQTSQIGYINMAVSQLEGPPSSKPVSLPP